MERSQHWELKMCKHEAEMEAKKFVEESANNIAKAVSREYRSLLKQFVSFRQTTWTVIDNMQDYGDRMEHAEKLVCQTFPVYDSRYRSDPDSPFRLYDCLVPALKQHIPVPEILLPKGYLADIGMQMKYHREKLAIEKIDIGNALAENRLLKATIEAQRN